VRKFSLKIFLTAFTQTKIFHAVKTQICCVKNHQKISTVKTIAAFLQRKFHWNYSQQNMQISQFKFVNKRNMLCE
jgi:hypothetical protein